MQTERIKPGVYRHYKGQEYDVYGTAIFSGTEDHDQGPMYFVIYRPRYGAWLLTCRPLDTFLGEVQSEKYKYSGQRFVFVREFEDPGPKVIVEFFSS